MGIRKRFNIFFILIFSCIPEIHAQDSIPYSDSTTGLHISFPKAWITSNVPGILDPPDGVYYSEYTDIHEDLHCVVMRRNLSSLERRESIYKSFLTLPVKDKNCLKTLKGRINHQYRIRQQTLHFYHPEEVDTFKALIINIAHNCDLFQVEFYCEKKYFKKYKLLFLDIANSVYFD